MKSLPAMLLLLIPAVGRAQQAAIPVSWQKSLRGDFSFAKRQSIRCTGRACEWAGCRTITATARDGAIFCETELNAATHSRLLLEIPGDSSRPAVQLVSIIAGRSRVYPLKSGWIRIDTGQWKRRVLKAQFDFTFVNEDNLQPAFQGAIFTRIQ